MGEGKFVAFRIQNLTNATIEFELQAKHERWRGSTATIQTSLVLGVPDTEAIYQVSLLHTTKKEHLLQHLCMYAYVYIIPNNNCNLLNSMTKYGSCMPRLSAGWCISNIDWFNSTIEC